MKQYATLEGTVYFWFAGNDTSGSGGDGASPAVDVRLAGAAVDAIPVLSPTPSLLTHANYPAGCYEVAVAATNANGFAANNIYAVFCTLAIDSQNPTGFIGSFDLKPVLANAKQLNGTNQTGRDIGANVLLSSGSGAGQLDFTSGVVKSNLAQILGTALTETAGYIAAGFKKLFNIQTPVLTVESVNQSANNNTILAHADYGNAKLMRTGADSDTGETLSDQIDLQATVAKQDIIDTNVDQIETAVITNAAGTDIAADIIAIKAETVLIVEDTNELQLDLTNDGRLDLLLDRILTGVEIRQSSVNDASASTTKFITNLTETDNDFWNRMGLLFTSGNNSGQMRRIKDYVGASKEITMQTPLNAAPANADTFIIISERAFITPDIDDIADQVCDELLADHTTVGSLAKKISDQVNPPSQTLNDYKATGFSTHDAAAVKTAIEADGAKLDHLWEMTEDDGGVRRLTDNALEQAPSGTGGDASAENQVAMAEVLKEVNQSLNGAKCVIDRAASTFKVYDTDGETLMFTVTKSTSGNIDTLTRT